MERRDGLHVVLGGSGSVGSAVARLLAEEAVAVRAVNRSGRIGFLPRRVQVRAAEAIELPTLRAACEGAAVIYHCIHPARDYGLLVPITRNVLAVAEETGAVLVMPGDMAPYGSVSGPISEDTPLRPRTATGRVHAEAAELVADAHAAGRVRAAVGRVAHAYGPYSRHAWPGADFWSALVAKPSKVLGDPDAPHTYTYLDDFARGLIILGMTDEALGRVWHIPSAPPIAPRDLLALIYDEAGMDLRLKVRGRVGLAVRALLNIDYDLLRQMQYQFTAPFIVDHGRFARHFPLEPTPHAEAVAITVAWLRRVAPRPPVRVGSNA